MKKLSKLETLVLASFPQFSFFDKEAFEQTNTWSNSFTAEVAPVIEKSERASLKLLNNLASKGVVVLGDPDEDGDLPIDLTRYGGLLVAAALEWRLDFGSTPPQCFEEFLTNSQIIGSGIKESIEGYDPELETEPLHKPKPPRLVHAPASTMKAPSPSKSTPKRGGSHGNCSHEATSKARAQCRRESAL